MARVLWLQFVGVAARCKGRRIASRCGRRPPALMPAGHEGRDPASGRWLGIAPERAASRQRKSAAPSPASRQRPGQQGPRQHDSAVRLRRGQINNVGKGNAGNTPASGNEGVGEHVRTRFQIGPKAVCGIAEPLFKAPHRTKKTCFFCRTVKENDPTVDLMSRRHPLSSTRTF